MIHTVSDPKGGSLTHIPALDGVRGLGIAGILLFHAGHWRGGWLGVDLFFVLSGFLITQLMLGEVERTGAVSLPRFWMRRARRLLPALFVLTLGVSVYALFLAEAEELARIRADGIATLAYVANWRSIFAGHDYWSLFTAPSPFEHAWSLAIEEQVYLLWPPLCWWVLRKTDGSRRVLGAVALALAVASGLTMAALFEPEGSTARVYFGTDTRAFAPLLGAAAAVITRKRIRRGVEADSSTRADVAAMLALGLLACAWSTLDGRDPMAYRGGLFALALVAAGLVASLLYAPRGWASRLLCVAPLRGLGVVSYGVYLWHWPVYIVLDPTRTGLEGWPLTALRIAVSLVAAAASYRLLERPVRRSAFSPRVAAMAGVGGALLCAMVLVGATRPLTEPIRSVGEADAAAFEAVLVGDSVVGLLAGGFRMEGVRRGLETEAFASLGCIQLATNRLRLDNGRIIELPGCEAHQRRWRSFVEAASPRWVLLLDGWQGGLEREVDGVWLDPCAPEFALAYEAGLGAAIELIRRSDSRPVILTAPPPTGDDFTDEMKAAAGHQRGESHIDRLNEETACQNVVRRRVADTAAVPVIDLAERVCPKGVCVREIDGVLLRSDGVHFRGAGAEIIASWLLDQVASLR